MRRTDTGDTKEIHHAIVQATDVNTKTIVDHTDIAQVLLAMIVQSLPGGTDIALPEIRTSVLQDAKKTVGEGNTQDPPLLQSENATTNVESAGVHLLHLAETIHEAYLLDLDARKLSSNVNVKSHP
jgi:hypothetical protein